MGKILVFARIPPENKALIIRTIKNQYIEDHKAKGLCYGLSKGDRLKVGMCGDGANDLLALR